jgi:hypothetical protein
MWKLLAASGALICAAGIAPLHSEELPWCVKMDVFTRNCAFASYDECVAVARNADASCIRNPNYQPPAAAAARPKAAADKAAAGKASQPQR